MPRPCPLMIPPTVAYNSWRTCLTNHMGSYHATNYYYPWGWTHTHTIDNRNNSTGIGNAHILLCNVMYYPCLPSKWQPTLSIYSSFLWYFKVRVIHFILRMYHFVAKQSIHLIWYSIPYWINSASIYIPTCKGKIYGFRIFSQRKKSVRQYHKLQHSVINIIA